MKRIVVLVVAIVPPAIHASFSVRMWQLNIQKMEKGMKLIMIIVRVAAFAFINAREMPWRLKRR